MNKIRPLLEPLEPELKELLWPQVQKDGSIAFIIPDVDAKKLPTNLRKKAKTLKVRRVINNSRDA